MASIYSNKDQHADIRNDKTITINPKTTEFTFSENAKLEFVKIYDRFEFDQIKHGTDFVTGMSRRKK